MAKEVAPHIPELEKHKEGLMAELVRKSGEIGLLGAGIPEEYGGAALDKISSVDLVGEAWRVFVFCGCVRRAHGNRDDSAGLFRHGRAEEEIFAEDCERRIAGVLRAFGAAGGLGRAGSASARRAFTRRQELAAERPENVDHQRRFFRSLYGVRESGWREVFGVSGGARDAGLFHRRGRKQDGDPRQFDGAAIF